jgi:hypothetical protein
VLAVWSYEVLQKLTNEKVEDEDDEQEEERTGPLRWVIWDWKLNTVLTLDGQAENSVCIQEQKRRKR